ncbi:MAG: patatin-like phospholipase family protein [Verrucomicrobiaceae bacterium]|nr:patatin-like phospholipase family protein [Verrucomicrobiaceae bacterium]
MKTPAVTPSPKIGLCLSSGGARGLAHVGVIEVLEHAGVPISAISGSSMGAYVGSLLALGLKAADLRQLAAEIRDRKTLLRLLDPIFPPSKGLIKGQKMRHHLERTLGTATFEELPIPLAVVAADLDTLRAHVFRKGNVAAAVHASAAIPGVFAPVALNGRMFTDGGAADPMPVSLLKETMGVDKVIAVDVVTDATYTSSSCLGWLNLLGAGNVLDTFHRSLITAQRQLVIKEAELADIVIRPAMTKSRWYDFENFNHYIEAGRAAAKAALPSILELLETENPDHRHETVIQQTRMGFLAA